MNYLLIADSFLPANNSASVLIKDFLDEVGVSNNITAVIPNNSFLKKTEKIYLGNKEILMVRTFNSKSYFLVYRTFSEIVNPILMLFAIKFHGIRSYDGIVWYSPSIFFGFIIKFLKSKKNTKSYLILRDIFPQWAVDTGILKKRFAYYIFKFFESFQYSIADKIGIQSTASFKYFEINYPHFLNKIEVLDNWMKKSKPIKSNINLSKTLLKNRFICIYSGNFGRSQQIDFLLDLAYFFKENKKIGFVFVGSGSEFDRIKESASINCPDNLLVLDSTPSEELSSLYEQCDIGLISLDLRHKTHNIPGKFISYLLSGLPVIAVVNEGNDLIEIINKNNLGVAFSSHNMKLFEKIFLKFIHRMNKKKTASKCISFADKNYSPKKAAKQIISFFLA